MKTFKESFHKLIEAKLKLPKGEKVAKEYNKLGRKKKTTAVITNKFNLYINDIKVDSYKSAKAAENGLKDFIVIMGA
tara:strand:- start:510 stop:740 length:231 start_codon:yes stop_codon:yes gene_type:complete